jgi:membrane protein DedA with SNARE-associated domain
MVKVALARVERHQVNVVLSMRFLWGQRIALPVSLGLTHMRAAKYFWLDPLSAAGVLLLAAVIAVIRHVGKPRRDKV